MDDLDSKMEAMRAHFEREADLESPWSSYNASLGRPLLNSAKYLAPKAAAPPVEPGTAESESTSGSRESKEAPTLPGFKF